MRRRPTIRLSVRLGNSGLKVSKIIFGCMSYGTPGWRLEQIKFAFACLSFQPRQTYVYSDGASEEILGKAIKESLGTKSDDEPGACTVNQHELSRKASHLRFRQHSLECLQLDYIDLLQCHRFDYETPIEETMQALHDVVQAGYSNYAITNKLTPFISMQNHHSLIYREEEREMFPTCKHFGVGIIHWLPLARGMLTRPIAAEKDTARGTGDVFIGRYKSLGGAEDIVSRVEEVAKKHGVPMVQVATRVCAFAIHPTTNTCTGVTVPIIGTTSIQKITDCIAAVQLQLTPEEMKLLEEPYLLSTLLDTPD
ncbi:aryl-alcohol dehydrogenase [Mycena olivaceomarginata]|nr:aryl-alcohol dehydrogenase [Mycena olivaceomarginata]